MSKIKNSIKSNIVSPEIDNNKFINTYAIVVKADKKLSECVVIYNNIYGNETRETLKVEAGSLTCFDWFPEEDDRVHITNINGSLVIDSPCSTSIYKKLRDDIFPDSNNSSISGMVGV